MKYILFLFGFASGKKSTRAVKNKRPSLSFVTLALMSGVLFLIYIVAIQSSTSVSYELSRLEDQAGRLEDRNRELVQLLNSRRSLAYIAEASKSLGLEEVVRPAYLDLQESGVIAQK